MKPTQEDRNRAASYLREIGHITGSEQDAILRGKWDSRREVLWFTERRSKGEAVLASVRVNLLLIRRNVTAARENVDALSKEQKRPTWKAINMLDHALKAVLGTSGALLKDLGVSA